MEHSNSPSHLTDAELFGLAIPAAGVPEALPAHLSDCLACSRALQEWKMAVRELGADGGPVDRRSPEEWAIAEEKTIETVRRARFARRPAPWRWAVGVAASILLFALAVPLRQTAPRARPGLPAASEMSAEDQADDVLLRDVARLSRDDDAGGSWMSLIPDSGLSTREEETL
ncbi:MAG: hypothetical protein M3R62_01760 [Acidobacteriota bacterium]|nr:hypothetical protein [Acidobacteriota bacterium]